MKHASHVFTQVLQVFTPVYTQVFTEVVPQAVPTFLSKSLHKSVCERYKSLFTTFKLIHSEVEFFLQKALH